jgi:hypothetical protein
VLVGVRFYALATRSLFLFNVTLAALWLLLGVFVVREHRRLRAERAVVPPDAAAGTLAGAGIRSSR